jgi:hypothetical protein
VAEALQRAVEGPLHVATLRRVGDDGERARAAARLPPLAPVMTTMRSLIVESYYRRARVSR